MEKKKRGLANCDPETRKRVATMGGKAVSTDKKRMSEMGRRGGLAVSLDKAHMSRIGKMGGSARRIKTKTAEGGTKA